jgi:hypothetical protein
MESTILTTLTILGTARAKLSICTPQEILLVNCVVPILDFQVAFENTNNIIR